MAVMTALALRALGLGDLLTAVPALRALRRGGFRVVLACPPELRDLVALTGAVDRLLPAYGVQPFAWPGTADPDSGLPPEPDLAVNLHGRGPESHRVLLAMRPRRLWAYANDDVPWMKGPSWAHETHEVRRWCELVEWYGLPADPDDLRLPIPMVNSPAPGAVVIHPGAKDPARRWPAERFAEVARAVMGDGRPVVVTGVKRERPLALLVGTGALLPPRLVLAGRTSLRELCALVAGARLVISGDTGVAHLATAYGTPSVVVFGAESPSRWGPPQNGGRHQVVRRGDDPADVPVEDVLKASELALGAATR